MNQKLDSPQILLLSLGFCFLCSIVLMVFGHRLVRKGDWLAWLGLVIPFGALTIAVIQWTDAGHRALIWSRGWIGERESLGSISVGLSQDGVGLILPLLIYLVSFIFVSSRAVHVRMKKPELAYSGTCAVAAGTSLAWLSSTPWLALLGWTVSALGGFLALGAQGFDEPESQAVTRYARERTWGLSLAWIGLCGLAISRNGLDWSATPGSSLSDVIGSILLLSGIFVQFELFPFLGGAAAASTAGISLRAILSILLPSVSAFGLLWRMEPFLRGQGFLQIFGAILIVAGALNLLSALLQPRWRQEFYPWIGASMAFCGATLAFGGQHPALSLLVALLPGTALMAISATFMGHAPEEGKGASSALKGTRGWTLFLSFAGTGATTGLLGFASTASIARVLGSQWGRPEWLAPMAVLYFFFIFVAWSLAWRLQEMKRPVFLTWTTLIPPVLLFFATLAIGWTGTLSGSPLFGGADQTSPAWLDSMSATALPLSEIAQASLLGLGLLLLAIVGSYFFSLRKNAVWAELPENAKGFKAFVVGAYRIDRVAARAMSGLEWFGNAARDRIDGRAWTAWASRAVETALRALAKFCARVDERISWAIRQGLRFSVESASGAVQALQSGDVQWYAMFAIGSSILLLLHFLT